MSCFIAHIFTPETDRVDHLAVSSHIACFTTFHSLPPSDRVSIVTAYHPCLYQILLWSLSHRVDPYLSCPHIHILSTTATHLISSHPCLVQQLLVLWPHLVNDVFWAKSVSCPSPHMHFILVTPGWPIHLPAQLILLSIPRARNIFLSLLPRHHSSRHTLSLPLLS